MAAFMAAIPPTGCSAADVPNWAAKFAATVDVARGQCSQHYLVRMKEAAKFLTRIRPRVDPDDPEVRQARDRHRERLVEYLREKDNKDICGRLHEVLGPKSSIVRTYKLKPIMVIRKYVKDEE